MQEFSVQHVVFEWYPGQPKNVSRVISYHLIPLVLIYRYYIFKNSNRGVKVQISKQRVVVMQFSVDVGSNRNSQPIRIAVSLSVS